MASPGTMEYKAEATVALAAPYWIGDGLQMAEPRPRACWGALVGCLAAMMLLAAGVPAAAQEDYYEVGGIEVDVSAESANVARDRAMIEGQRKAYDVLVRRFAQESEIARLPALTDTEIADMVQDFTVDSERLSAVRYAGVMTFRFFGQPVRDLLAGGNVQFAAPSAKAVLVLPVLTVGGAPLLWGDNAWHAAWAARRAGSELVALVVPLGDLDDIAAIDAAAAIAGDGPRLAQLGARYGTAETLVAMAQPGTEGGQPAIVVQVLRYGPSGRGESFEERIVGSGETVDQLYVQAVERVAASVQEGWKSRNLVAAGPQRSLAVTIPILALNDWVEIRRRLAAITSVRRSEVLYVSRKEAKLNLDYLGDEVQLQRVLAERDLELAQAPDGGWWLGIAGRLRSVMPAGAAAATITSP